MKAIRGLALGGVIAILSGLIGASARASEAGRFQGVEATNQMLRERLLKAPQEGAFPANVIGHYLGEDYRGFGGSLSDLLGVYDAVGVDSHLRNADPNAANLVLWHLALSGLSGEVSLLCGGTPVGYLNLSDAFMDALRPLCAWPAKEARADANLLNYWIALMQFDAPFEEYEAWRAFILGPEWASATAKEAVFAMTFAALYNPYFLLRK